MVPVMPREDDDGSVGRCRVALFSGSVVVTLRPPLTPLPEPRECLFGGARNGMGMVFPQPYLQQESVLVHNLGRVMDVFPRLHL